MVLQTKAMTVEAFDEFVRLPENRNRLFEYIGGKVVEVVSNPASSHIGARLGAFIGMYLLEHDIGRVTGANGGYVVSGERYMPNAGFIRYVKQPELSYDEVYNPNPPDLAVEVFSPNNPDEDIAVKVVNYLTAGTVVWRANPLEKQIAVFVSRQKVKILRLEDTLDGGDVLPGFSLPLRKLFSSRKQ